MAKKTKIFFLNNAKKFIEYNKNMFYNINLGKKIIMGVTLSGKT